MADAGNLRDRVIAIAGVGGGLGPAVAARLAEAGAIVAGANRGEGEADAVRRRVWGLTPSVGTGARSTSPTRTR